MIRELVAVTIESSGDRLLQAADGGEGLATARAQRPDIIFLDINMPVMDGFAVCQALKSDPETRGISIVMLTALGADADRARAKRLGADDYFTKPFSPLTLLRKVDQVLGSRGGPTTR
ncbi:MAG: response regulator [Chloroflexota bacterium]|nr:MAG: response regulator [Chloroflexota bacterium]